MKIACIYPSIINPRVDYPGQFEPLGIQYIASTATSMGHETQLFIPDFGEDLETFIERILKFDLKVAAFSVMTCQVNDSVNIIKKIKESKKNVVAIAGGPHPTVKPEDLLKGGFNFCVRGEGEIVFKKILQNISNGDNIYKIPSITFLNNGKIKNNPLEKRAELDKLPCPLRIKSFLAPKTYKGMAYPAPNIKGWASISTHRGCPHACSFCDSFLIWGKRITYRSVDDVVNEMIYLYDNYDTELFHFTDLNFTANKKYVLQLCDKITTSKKKFHWFCMANVNTTFDNEVVAAMKQAGCTLISVGIESTNSKTLTKVNKEFNEKMFEFTDLLSKAEIPVNVFYMICFPWESEETIMRDAEKLYEMNAHKVKVSIATPFPKTELWYMIKDKILLNSYHLYNTDNLVYKHNSITPEKAKDLKKAITKNFYLNSKFKKRIIDFLTQAPKFKDTFKHFYSLLPFWNEMQKMFDNKEDSNARSKYS